MFFNSIDGKKAECGEGGSIRHPRQSGEHARVGSLVGGNLLLILNIKLDAGDIFSPKQLLSCILVRRNSLKFLMVSEWRYPPRPPKKDSTALLLPSALNTVR